MIMSKQVKNIDPIDPAIVLFGLIFVSFGPLNNLPNSSPPTSEAIQPNNKINKINFKWKKFEKMKNKTQNKNTKTENMRLLINIVFTREPYIFLVIFVNSKIEITPKTIKVKLKI